MVASEERSETYKQQGVQAVCVVGQSGGAAVLPGEWLGKEGLVQVRMTARFKRSYFWKVQSTDKCVSHTYRKFVEGSTAVSSAVTGSI